MKLRITAIALAIAAALLAGCAPAGTQTQDTTAAPTPTQTQAPAKEASVKAGETYRILIWDNYNENDWVLNNRSGRAGEIKKRWEAFQQQYGISITYIASPGETWFDEACSTAAAMEPMCDIFHAGGPFALVTAYGYGGGQGSILEPLSDYPQAGSFSDTEYWNVEAQANNATFGGKLYFAIPLEVGFGQVAYNQVTFFNKDLCARAGYEADRLYEMSKNGEWTFDAMRQVAIACNDPDNGVWGLNYGQNNCAMFAMVTANGGAYFEVKDGVPYFDGHSQNTLDAVDYFVKLAKDDKVVYMEGAPGYDDDHPPFVRGKHALMLTYANRAEKMYKNKKLSFGILMPPKGPAAQDYISDSNWFTPYCVMKGTKNPAGCVQVIEEYLRPECGINSPENQEMFHAECTMYTSDDGSFETLSDVRSKTKSSSLMSWISVATNDSYIGGCFFGSVQSWIKGEGTPAQHYAAVESAVNETVKNMLGAR